MRSLSPAPSRYSAASGALSAVARTGGSAATAMAGCRATAAKAAATKRVTNAVWFMDAPSVSVLIGGGTRSVAPIDQRPRHRLTLQRRRVDGMRRITGRADRDAKCGLE